MAADEARREAFRRAVEALEGLDAFVFVSHRAHFHDPLIEEQWEALADCEAVADAEVLRVTAEVLPRYAPGSRGGAREDSAGGGAPALERSAAAGGESSAERASGVRRPVIFFPVPMARALAQRGERVGEDEGEGEAEGAARDAEERAIVDRFHYDLIQVDAEQRWSWRGRPVGERARRFFLEHVRWFPRVARWGFEYKVHDGWWDKSYLDAEVTPLLAIRLEEVPTSHASAERTVLLQRDPVERTRTPSARASAERTTDKGETCLEENSGERAEDRRAVAHLASGQAAAVDLDSFRLDERERLFCRVDGLGEVMLSDTVRFQIVSTASEDLSTIEVAGSRRPLRWPLP